MIPPSPPNITLFASQTAVVDDGTYGIFIETGGGGSFDACLQLADTVACALNFLNDTPITNDTWPNATRGNGTDDGSLRSGDDEDLTHYIVMTLTTVLLGLMILMTVIGNVFVIAAICVDRNLRSVANYLVASLALADLMVACLVMPFGALYEVDTYTV